MNLKPFIILSAFILIVTGCQDSSPSVIEKKFLMDTVVTIKSYDLDTISKKDTDRALEAAFAKIRSVEKYLSVFEKTSETTKINKQAGTTATIEVSRDMWEALTLSKKMASLTQGGFDPTIGPLTKLWHFENQSRVPKKDELRDALRLINSEDIILDEQARSARLRRENMRLDLGGIAKGIALDRAAKELARRGLKNVLVTSVSGTKAQGPKPGNLPWLIGIQSPRPRKTPNLIGIIKLRKGSISTSGDYQQFFMKKGRRYHHLLNPKSGFPARAFMSVTVVTQRSSAFADALSTGLSVLTPAKARALVESLDAVEAILVNVDGKIWVSSGLKGKIQDLISKVRVK